MTNLLLKPFVPFDPGFSRKDAIYRTGSLGSRLFGTVEGPRFHVPPQPAGASTMPRHAICSPGRRHDSRRCLGQSGGFFCAVVTHWSSMRSSVPRTHPRVQDGRGNRYASRAVPAHRFGKPDDCPACRELTCGSVGKSFDCCPWSRRNCATSVHPLSARCLQTRFRDREPRSSATNSWKAFSRVATPWRLPITVAHNRRYVVSVPPLQPCQEAPGAMMRLLPRRTALSQSPISSLGRADFDGADGFKRDFQFSSSSDEISLRIWVAERRDVA